MKKVINTILLVVIGVSLSGCEWFEHENSNKKNEVEVEDSPATELISRGGSGYIVLIDEIKVDKYEEQINSRWVSKDTVIYKSEHNDSIPIDIDVDDLKYDPNKWHENNIKIRIGCNTEYIDYNIGSGGGGYSGGVHFGELYYDGKSYVMEEVFKLNPESDTLFIDFVHRKGVNNQGEIGLGNSRYSTPLTSSQIEDSIRNGNYEIIYISLSWVPNTLPRECYNIGGKMYTKSMMGDRWIYLANQYPPLGYMTSTNETHMIACVKLKTGKENGFDEYYKVSTIRSYGYCSNVVRDKNPENPHITKSRFNN